MTSRISKPIRTSCCISIKQLNKALTATSLSATAPIPAPSPSMTPARSPLTVIVLSPSIRSPIWCPVPTTALRSTTAPSPTWMAMPMPGSAIAAHSISLLSPPNLDYPEVILGMTLQIFKSIRISNCTQRTGSAGSTGNVVVQWLNATLSPSLTVGHSMVMAVFLSIVSGSVPGTHYHIKIDDGAIAIWMVTPTLASVTIRHSTSPRSRPASTILGRSLITQRFQVDHVRATFLEAVQLAAAATSSSATAPTHAPLTSMTTVRSQSMAVRSPLIHQPI